MGDDIAVLGFRAGDVIAEKYRVERVLGIGGMGVVIAAMHVHLRERVALKFLLPDRAQSPNSVARFMREARAAVRIRNEHVARVLDTGLLDSGAPYIVMELLEGTSLSSLLHEGGALPIDTTIEYVLQACVAIAEAHALGIVHRDLKPSNLFVTWNADGTPCVKVLDFGISKFADVDEGIITKSAVIIGSPSYMAPEQLESAHEVDARADIWSLGVLLYELVTGVRPFVAGSIPALCTKIVRDSPIPPRQIRPDLPQGVETAILMCLERDLDKRLPYVAALADALAPYAPPSARRSLERIERFKMPDGGSSSGARLLSCTSAGASSQEVSATDRIPAPMTDSSGPSRRKVAIVAALALAAAGGTLVLARGALSASPGGTLIAETIPFPETFGRAMSACISSATDFVPPLVPAPDVAPNESTAALPARDSGSSGSRGASAARGRRATAPPKTALFPDRNW